jgi:uncharacterized protein YkwD
VLCAATLALPASALADDCTPLGAWPGARSDASLQVVRLVNAHRAERGLPALAISPTLTAGATLKAREMAASGTMEHGDPGALLAACGYRASAAWAENLAMGYASARAVVAGWLASPGHRANLERRSYRAVGVAAAGAPAYWALELGSVVDRGSVTARTAAQVRCSSSGPVTCRVG